MRQGTHGTQDEDPADPFAVSIDEDEFGYWAEPAPAPRRAVTMPWGVIWLFALLAGAVSFMLTWAILHIVGYPGTP